MMPGNQQFHKLVWLMFAVFVIAERLSEAIQMPSWCKQKEVETCVDGYGSVR
jgi:hypothetical protein